MKVEIIINNVAYPSRMTMGAMLRFKQQTGKEITELDANNFSDLCTLLYCCVASASAADGLQFNMSLMEFADALNPEDLTAWSAQMKQGAMDAVNAVEGEKKS